MEHLHRVKAVMSVVLYVVAGWAMSSYAEDGPPVVEVDPQPLAAALNSFSEQTGIQFAYVSTVADGVESPGTSGEAYPAQALDLMLAETGLTYSFINDTTIVILAADGLYDGYKGGASDLKNLTPTPVLMAQNQTSQSRTTRSDSEERDEPDYQVTNGEDARLEEIVVTGTHIRGIAPESSPVLVFDREDIDISGAATAQDFIQTLPQNFGGGSNLTAIQGTPGNDNSRFNNPSQGGSGGVGVNLRGLGSGSTLVLVNGHRLAPSSGIGNFVDISLIPASAIERIEVLTDGASSIYGSDAVAGVVNIILREDYDSAEVSFRYGAVTEGSMDESRVSAKAGKSWNKGHVFGSYEYYDKGSLSAEDRSFARDALASSPVWGLPTDLLPSEERHSVLATASQNVTRDIKLAADLAFSSRETVFLQSNLAGNPVPRGAESKNWNVASSASWEFLDSWFLDFAGAYSDVTTDSDVGVTSSIVRRVESDLWSADAKVSGPLFALPGGEVSVALGVQYREEDFSNTLLAGNPATNAERFANRDLSAFFGEVFIPVVGSANAIPGIERLEINVSGRRDDYSDFGSTTNPKYGALWSPTAGLNFRGTYGTSFLPPPLGRIGAADFIALAYPTAVFNAILGNPPGDPSIADVVAISVNGTAKDLVAEESRTYTAGVDFEQDWGKHNLTASLTWFDTEFEGRLGRTPTPDNSIFNVPNLAFNQPELFPPGTVIFFPDSTQIAEVLNSLDQDVTEFLGAVATDASIIHFTNVVRNLGFVTTSGFDADISYSYESDHGQYLIGLNASYLTDLTERAAVTTPAVDQLDILFNPVAFRLRSRIGYNNQDFSANLFINYTDSYAVANSADSAPIDSWTTVDLNLSYDTGTSPNYPVLSNTLFRLSVINLFDEDPPGAPGDVGFLILGYDSANASPLGRFIAIEVTKRF